jgi:indolepyruvate ferredoxin oxidoreductase
MLAADLVAYQDARYAGRFLDTVAEVAEVERSRDGAPGRLTLAVARSLHKLMAYKDEYEVARLLTGPEARAAADAVGGPGATVSWRLHPPLLKALGMSDKVSVPEQVGRPVMLALRGGKRLRGTRLDPFGRTEIRRAERAIVGEYLDAIRSELGVLRAGADPADFERVVAVAELPMDVRGYEELKMRRIAELRARLAARAAERRPAHHTS